MGDVTAVKSSLRGQRIELPSWAFGNTGTRFKVFAQPGVPRTPQEKIDDAAQVHAFTGVAPSVAVHIPWDKVGDYAELAAYARDRGVAVGTVNANVFQDDDYRLGSVANPDPAVRAKAVDALLECVDVMDQTGSRDLKLWFADGTNYPGQDDIGARQERLAGALAQVYERLGAGQRMLLEYKLFEPSFYTTDVPDWGTSLVHCLALGERAQVVVDTGHHAPGVNIEFIVAMLLRAGRLAEALAVVYERLGPDQRMLLEYKLFEPSFYTTDVPDWGTSLVHCLALGQRAQVVVDTGHHAPGVNIEFIVAMLLRAGRLGGFDFNSRFYADDDLMVGAADPFQLFRILNEVAAAGALAPAAGVAFMLDQCHNIEPKIPAQIRSVMNVQEATAKALLIDRGALGAAQRAGDVLGANAVLMDAYNTDVRPLLADLRAEMGLDPDPVAAYQRSGYAQKIVADRVGGTPASWDS